ncbi:MAG: DGQHR domain-containing protein [Ochrobactrum anthropi]|uniref:DGQHR domain-containing protein n=1 Tax=Brucella anthropi TaxID=529 RepID=A0A8I0T9X9_BRUAN|nr:DGQHR domain-containing protein [Brucella anthropi]MBE0563188.1 DGQHR domain-containing protein [Brucella anthropi]
MAVTKVSQPIGDFYVGRIPARTLLRMSYVEIRRFQEGTQDRIAGIQRERSEGRIGEIKKYVNLDYATFPTSIVIAIPEECVALTSFCSDQEPDEGDTVLWMTLSPFGSPEDEDHISMDRIAFIIDGQHRLAGLEGLDPRREFDVNVSIFIGASDADKAEIFARVNQAQTKVNQSLVIDLASFYQERGPVKFAHEVVLALNADEHGPLYDKVKRLGKAAPGKGRVQTLAQATVVKPVVDYITSDPEGERNKRYKGLFSSKRAPDAWRRYIFQPFYDEDDDGGIFACLTNYFSAVRSRWPTSWDDAPTGGILNRTTGYAALMRFLRPVYTAHCSSGEVLKEAVCREIFSRVSIEDQEFTRDNFLPGSAGISTLYKRLLAESGVEEY